MQGLCISRVSTGISRVSIASLSVGSIRSVRIVIRVVTNTRGIRTVVSNVFRVRHVIRSAIIVIIPSRVSVVIMIVSIRVRSVIRIPSAIRSRVSRVRLVMLGICSVSRAGVRVLIVIRVVFMRGVNMIRVIRERGIRNVVRVIINSIHSMRVRSRASIFVIMYVSRMIGIRFLLRVISIVSRRVIRAITVIASRGSVVIVSVRHLMLIRIRAM